MFLSSHMDETSLENANFETSFDYDHGLFDDVVIVAFCKIEPKKNANSLNLSNEVGRNQPARTNRKG